MSTPVYIGDEVSAAGYRLAGLVTRVPEQHELTETLSWAREHAPLILIGAALAERIPDTLLNNLLSAVTPPAMIVPDVRERSSRPDPGEHFRRLLGVLE